MLGNLTFYSPWLWKLPIYSYPLLPVLSPLALSGHFSLLYTSRAVLNAYSVDQTVFVITSPQHFAEWLFFLIAPLGTPSVKWLVETRPEPKRLTCFQIHFHHLQNLGLCLAFPPSHLVGLQSVQTNMNQHVGLQMSVAARHINTFDINSL